MPRSCPKVQKTKNPEHSLTISPAVDLAGHRSCQLPVSSLSSRGFIVSTARIRRSARNAMLVCIHVLLTVRAVVSGPADSNSGP
ncbi:hypothetical protein ACS0TY_021040 [Phlomoides rotata]